MTPTSETLRQIEQALRRLSGFFPQGAAPVLTDIHVQVSPSSGELVLRDDDDRLLSRDVVEQWASDSPSLLDEAAAHLRDSLSLLRRSVVDQLSLLRPYSFLLEDEDRETVCDLYLVDDDRIQLTGSLMQDLEGDLSSFLARLLAD